LLFIITAAAADGEVYTEGYFYYTVSDQSITITGYFGNETVVTVPSSIAGIPVNAVGPDAFAGTSVQILYLPDTIRELGENATGTADVRFIGQPTAVPQESETPQSPGGATASQMPSNSAATGNPGSSNEEVGGAEPLADGETNTTPTAQATDSEQQTPSGEWQTEAPNAETATKPVLVEEVTAAPETTNAPETPVSPAEKPKNLTWLWITLGAAAAAGGTAAGVAAVRRSKKK